MSNPPPYVPSFSFAGFQETNPTDPPPGTMLDNEHDNIADSLNTTISALANIRRSDGALVNGIVTLESLAADITIGVQTPSAWVTAHVYSVGNLVIQANKFYVCLVAHTSGVFATDLAAVKWSEVTLSITGYASDQVTYDHTISGLAAVTVKTALDEIDAKADATNVVVAAKDARGADIAAAATTNLATATGDYVHITGAGVNITAFGTANAGVERDIVFDGINTIIYNATSMITLSGASIVTAAGDAARVRSEGSGNWRFLSYNRAIVTLREYQLARSTTVAGTTKDITVPSDVVEVVINLESVSLSGTDSISMWLGDAGGIEVAGYVGSVATTAAASIATAVMPATSWTIGTAGNASNQVMGSVVLKLSDPVTNTWLMSFIGGYLSNTVVVFCAGQKATSQALTTIRIGSTLGVQTLDNGAVSGTYKRPS